MDSDLQLLPERRKKIDVFVPGENRLLSIGIVVLVLIVLLFIGTTIYKQSLISSVETTDTKLADLEKRRDRDLEKKLLELNQRLGIASSLLDSHLLWTQAFTKIQSMTQSQVQFRNFSSNIREKKFVFKAEAASYQIVAQQIAIFLDSKDITNIALDKVVALPTGRLEFNMTLNFEPDKLITKAATATTPTP